MTRRDFLVYSVHGDMNASRLRGRHVTNLRIDPERPSMKCIEPKTNRAVDPSKENAAVTALENGFSLRNWVAEILRGTAVQCIRCATFSIGSPGILWLTAIENQNNAKVLLLSDVDQTDANIALPQFRQLLSAGLVAPFTGATGKCCEGDWVFSS